MHERTFRFRFKSSPKFLLNILVVLQKCQRYSESYRRTYDTLILFPKHAERITVKRPLKLVDGRPSPSSRVETPLTPVACQYPPDGGGYVLTLAE